MEEILKMPINNLNELISYLYEGAKYFSSVSRVSLMTTDIVHASKEFIELVDKNETPLIISIAAVGFYQSLLKLKKDINLTADEISYIKRL